MLRYSFPLSRPPENSRCAHYPSLIADLSIGLTLVAAASSASMAAARKSRSRRRPRRRPPHPRGRTRPRRRSPSRSATPGPLTGGIAHLGKDDENGVHLAVDEANAKKLKIGGKTVKFEMMSEDDQADPKLGPTIAQKFVDAKVAGVVGHLNSGVSIPASAVYNQAGIPMISGSATNPKLTEQGFKTIFRTVGRDDQQGPAIAAYIANELKLKKVAIADDATAYGEGLANEVEKTLKAAGVQIVAREKTNDKATDFKAILTKIKGKPGRRLLRRHGRHRRPDAEAGARARHQGDVRIRRRRVHGRDEQARRRHGVRRHDLLAGRHPDADGVEGVPDAFKAKYGEVKQYAPFFYDGANLLIAAMQKADSTDPAKYLPELQKISFDGATGHIEFDAKGDRKDAEMTIFQMKDGKVEPVAIIKAGKTTKIGGDTAAARRPLRRHRPHPAMAPAIGDAEEVTLHPQTENGAREAPFSFGRRRDCPRGCCAAIRPALRGTRASHCRNSPAACTIRHRLLREPVAWTSFSSSSSTG